MTRAGEKLYGDCDRAPQGQGLFASRRFWRSALDMILLLTFAAIALFGFG